MSAMDSHSRKGRRMMLPRRSLPKQLILVHLLFLSSLLANQRGAFGFGSVSVKPFGTSEGKQVDMYMLSWGSASADILTFGATLRALRVPDRYGVIDDVVTGFDTLDTYLTKQYRYGCIKGRFGTSLLRNQVTVGGQTYNISGGGNNFCYKIYTAMPIKRFNGVGVKLQVVSPAGEDGYPGTVQVTATYMLMSKGAATVLTLEMQATTDSTTYVNLVHHPYFNLGGHKKPNLTTTGMANEVKFGADRYLPGNVTTRVPDGSTPPVRGTAFDLRCWTPVGRAVDKLIAKTSVNGVATVTGFDDYFVLSNSRLVNGKRLAAEMRYGPSGRKVAIYTNQPGFIFFTGHRISNTIGKGGVPYTNLSFHALESSAYRDAPNKPNFPSVRLDPGMTYKHDITYVLETYSRKGNFIHK